MLQRKKSRNSPIYQPLHAPPAEASRPKYAAVSPSLGGKNSSFLRYSRWYVHNAFSISAPRGAESPFRFPCECPFSRSEVSGDELGCHSRRRNRWRRLSWRMKWVNELFAYHSWLALGCPASSSQYVPASGCVSSSMVRGCAFELLAEVRGFGCSGVELSSSPPEGGRKNLSNMIHSFHMHEYSSTQLQHHTTQP